MSDTRPGRARDRRADLSTLKLERRADGQLWLKRDEDSKHWYEAVAKAAKPGDGNDKNKDDGGSGGPGDVAVRVAPCFPGSRTHQYVSLRTAEDKEIALVHDLSQLAEDTRRLVEETLAEVGFVLEIARVEAIRTEFEIRNWEVVTRQGPCTFQTKLDEWPHPLPSGGFLLRDVAGNLFVIPDPATLDQRSRKLLWPFVG
jgi:hypothetical protein